MGFLGEQIPNLVQWIGLFAGLAGTGLTFWAAMNARGARRAAQEARVAAERTGHWIQLADLIDELSEIRILLHQRQFELIATKCGRFRSRIVRLKRRTYNDLDSAARELLDQARDLLADVAEQALNRRTIEETKINRIQSALSDADEAFGTLLGQLEPRLEE